MFGGGPEIWREATLTAEAARLVASPTWRGKGIEPGDGAPVLLIPGFLAGDESLWMMRRWLGRVGYSPHGSGIRSNIGCSESAIGTLEERVVELSERHGRPVSIIGHSRGGMFGRVLAVRNPDRVDRVIAMGSPLVASMEDVHGLVRFQIRTVQRVQGLGARRLIGSGCESSWNAYRFGLEPEGCCTGFWTDMDDRLPARVGFASLYSRSDGVIHWRACLDPQARHVEVSSTHCGMAFNRDVYEAVAGLMSGPIVASVTPLRVA